MSAAPDDAAPADPYASDPDWLDLGVDALQARMSAGALTSQALTEAFLARIERLNPVLHAVIEVNPDAIAIATALDAERAASGARGPLHGIPVLIKDNIDTADAMQTSAGSLALVGRPTPVDAGLVTRLRAAGAVLLGKTNLSEWANFRGGEPDHPSVNGWSARGGFTRNPYRLDLDPSGSSSGSGSAMAAGLAVLTVGTETDGSILSPSAEQSLVGIKPTVGLVPGDGIVPISTSQDTAGPMTRTVADAARLLDALRHPGPSVLGGPVPASYTDHLDADALRGARLAFDRRYATPPLGADPESVALVEAVLDRLRAAGAEVVEVTTADPVAPGPDGRIPYDDEFTVLVSEIKVAMAAYLARRGGTGPATVSDLIAFNLAHAETELAWFGQEQLETADLTSGDPADPEYLAARASGQRFAAGVIDGLLAEGFDAVVSPSGSYATSVAAVSGYPSMSVPAGYTADGRPVGLWLAAGFLGEPRLIELGYAIEQLLDARVPPTLAGEPSEPTPFPGATPEALAAHRPMPLAERLVQRRRHLEPPAQD